MPHAQPSDYYSWRRCSSSSDTSVSLPSDEAIEPLLYAKYLPVVIASVSKHSRFASKCGIDTEQLSLDILHEFIAQVSSQNTIGCFDIENAELLLLIRTIAKRRTINAVRKATRFSRHFTEYSQSQRDCYTAAQADDPNDAMVDREIWIALEESLTPTQFRIVQLLRQGNTYRQVAAELAITVRQLDTVRRNLEDTVRKLLDALSKRCALPTSNIQKKIYKNIDLDVRSGFDG
jgi:DNA-binding CsgD family transcriptional regulator